MEKAMENKDKSERIAALTIQRIPGIGPTYAKRLIEVAGRFTRIVSEGQRLAKAAGVPEAYLARIDLHRKEAEAAAVRDLDRAERLGLRVMVLTDPDYPARLLEISDPPTALYIYGEMGPADGVSIGVVGTRKASVSGLKWAQDIGTELARMGVEIVSGLAMGIDAAAHTGALAVEGGRTVAVLGTGVDVCYPASNRSIYDRIRSEGRGALVSEYPPGTEPAAHHFPVRNRIVSGLTMGVVVVEAPERSGALITAHMALEQGREVFAVPHAARSPGGAGTNRLLKDGAHLVERVEDILTVLDPQVRTRRVSSAAGSAGPAARRLSHVFELIESGVTALDDLVERSGKGVSPVLAELTRLEIEGRIRREHAGTYQVCER